MAARRWLLVTGIWPDARNKKSAARTMKPYDMNRWLVLKRLTRWVWVKMVLLKAVVGGLILLLSDIGVSSQGI